MTFSLPHWLLKYTVSQVPVIQVTLLSPWGAVIVTNKSGIQGIQPVDFSVGHYHTYYLSAKDPTMVPKIILEPKPATKSTSMSCVDIP